VIAPIVALPTGEELPGPLCDVDIIRHALWHFGLPEGREPGSFRIALFSAFSRADAGNFERLRMSFPVEAFWISTLQNREDGAEVAHRVLTAVLS
jgi:hypothetical protein